MVIWIIGKSGSGKSFITAKLYKKIKKKIKKVKWIDGDKFRKKYSKDLGFSLKDRKTNSKRIQRYCKYLDKRDYVVLCSVLSIFKEHQKENRKIFANYLQIFIKANQKLLEKRNNKKIYSRKINVVGRDIPFVIPYKNDLIIKNNFNKYFGHNVKKVLKKVNEKL